MGLLKNAVNAVKNAFKGNSNNKKAGKTTSKTTAKTQTGAGKGAAVPSGGWNKSGSKAETTIKGKTYSGGAAKSANKSASASRTSAKSAVTSGKNTGYSAAKKAQTKQTKTVQKTAAQTKNTQKKNTQTDKRAAAPSSSHKTYTPAVTSGKNTGFGAAQQKKNGTSPSSQAKTRQNPSGAIWSGKNTGFSAAQAKRNELNTSGNEAEKRRVFTPSTLQGKKEHHGGKGGDYNRVLGLKESLSTYNPSKKQRPAGKSPFFEDISKRNDFKRITAENALTGNPYADAVRTLIQKRHDGRKKSNPVYSMEPETAIETVRAKYNEYGSGLGDRMADYYTKRKEIKNSGGDDIQTAHRLDALNTDSADMFKLYEDLTGGIIENPNFDMQKIINDAEKKSKTNARDNKYYSRLNQYYALKDRPDFEFLANKAVGRNKLDDILSRQTPTGDDIRSMSAEQIRARAAATGYGSHDDTEKEKYTLMTGDERKIYRYILNTAGEKQADEYLDRIDQVLDERAAQARSQEIEDRANKNKLTAAAQRVALGLFKPGAYFDAGAQAIRQRLSDDDTYMPYNPYTDAGNVVNETQAMQRGITRDMSGGQKFLTDMGLNVADNAARLPLGAAGLADMALGAAGEAAVNRGLKGETSAGRAFATGTAYGAAEYLTEKIPFERLRALASAPPTTVKQTAKEILKQMGTEATEEAVSNVADNVADRVINGDNSEYDKYVMEQIQNGVTPHNAHMNAFYRFYLKDTAAEALQGGLSGGVLAGGSIGAGTAGNTLAAGREINEQGAAGDVINEGLRYDPQTGARKSAMKNLNRMFDNGSVSDMRAGRQFMLNENARQEEDARRAAWQRITGAQTGRADTLGGPNAKIETDETGNRRIVIANDAKTGAYDNLAHENTHAIADLAPEQFRTYTEYLRAAAEETSPGAYDQLRSRIRDQKARTGQDVSDRAVDEEAGAIIAEMFKPTTQQLRRIANGNQTIADTAMDAIDNAISKLKSRLMPKKSASRYGIEYTAAQLENAKQLWRDAAREAAQSTANGNADDNAATVRYSPMETDKYGRKYWRVDSQKDIFRGITKISEIKKAAYNFILGEANKMEIKDTIDGKNIIFNRVGAKEYVYGAQSIELEAEHGVSAKSKKMRLAPSIDDLIENASVSWTSPDQKNHKQFAGYFDNYRGMVAIDNTKFNYIVRVGHGKSKHRVFYDVNLELVEEEDNGARELGKNPISHKKNKPLSSSRNSLYQNDPDVKYSLEENSENSNTAQNDTNAAEEMAQIEREMQRLLERKRQLMEAARGEQEQSTADRSAQTGQNEQEQSAQTEQKQNAQTQDAAEQSAPDTATDGQSTAEQDMRQVQQSGNEQIRPDAQRTEQETQAENNDREQNRAEPDAQAQNDDPGLVLPDGYDWTKDDFYDEDIEQSGKERNDTQNGVGVDAELQSLLENAPNWETAEDRRLKSKMDRDEKKQALKAKMQEEGVASPSLIAPETVTHEESKKQRNVFRGKESFKRFLSRMYTFIVDDKHPIWDYNNAFEKAMTLSETIEGGKTRVVRYETMGRNNPYKMALNSKLAQNRAAYQITDELTDFDANPIGKGLIQTIEDSGIKKGTYKDFNKYLVAKHAAEWLDDKKHGEYKIVYNDAALNNRTAAEAMAKDFEDRYPEFKKAAENIYEWQRKMMKAWLVDTGVIDERMYDMLNDMYEYYVPFQRERDVSIGRPKLGFANEGNVIQTAHGSDRRMFDPIESIMYNTAAYVNAATKRAVTSAMIKMYDTLNADPGNNILREFMEEAEPISPNDEYPTAFRIKDGDRFRDNKESVNIKDRRDTETEMPETIMNISEALRRQADVKDGIVALRQDSGTRYFRVYDKSLLNTLDNTQLTKIDTITAHIAAVTRIRAGLFTSWNPTFAFGTNAVRDISTYLMNTTERNRVKALKEAATSYVDMFKKSDHYKQYLAMGGRHSNVYTEGMNEMRRALRILDANNSKLVTRFLKKAPFAIFETYNNIGDTIEAAPRLGEFKTSKAKGYDIHEAMFRAKDVTTNFSRSGALGRYVNAFSNFFNASIQGADKFFRKAKTDPLGFSIGAATLIIPELFAYAWNHIPIGDEEEQKEKERAFRDMSNWQKNNNYLFYKGNGQFWAIPKSHESSTPASATEAILETVLDGNDERFNEFFSGYIIDAFMPDLSVPYLTSKWQVETNKDYRKIPIVSASLSYLPAVEQYDDNTSFAARWIATVINKSPEEIRKLLTNAFSDSPKMIDHFIKNETGVFGKINSTYGTPNGLRDKRSMFTFGLDDTFIKDSVYSTDQVNYFYDRMNSAQTTADGDPTPDNLCLSKRYDQASKVISAINKMHKAIKDSNSEAAREIKREYVQFARANKNNPGGLSSEVYDKIKPLAETDEAVLTLPDISTKLKAKVNGKDNEYIITDPATLIDYRNDLNKAVDDAYRKVISSVEYGEMTDSEKVNELEKAKKNAVNEVKRLYVEHEGKERYTDTKQDAWSGVRSRFIPRRSAGTGATQTGTIQKASNEEVQQYKQKQEQREKTEDRFETIAENITKNSPETSDKYKSSSNMKINDVKSYKYDDGVSYTVTSDVKQSLIDDITDEHYTNVEKLFNNEVNVEDVVGKTETGRARQAKNLAGEKVDLTGKLYNDDGTPRFDDLVIEKIIVDSKEQAKKNVFERRRDELTGKTNQ